MFTIFKYLEELIISKSYIIIKNHKEAESFLLVESNLQNKQGLIIAFEMRGDLKEIKTAFYKPASKIKKILNKNKNLL